MSGKTRLLIVDDQRIFAEGLQYVIEARAPEFEVTGIARNGEEALGMLREIRPDIILMDVRMDVMDGVEATKRVHHLYPEIKILILTTFDDDEYVRESIAHGAVGYLLKNRPPEELIDSIRAMQNGIMQIDPAVTGKLFRSGRPSYENDPIMNDLKTLTHRECEVLRLLVEARKIGHIARELDIAEQTVRNHVSNIYSKLGIHNQIEIVRIVNQIRYFLDHLPTGP